MKTLPLLLIGQFLFASLLYANAGPGPDTDWQLDKDSDGVLVHFRKVEGSDYVEFRGETVLDASLQRIMRMLEDTPNWSNWMHQCKNPTLLKLIDSHHRYAYMVNDLPWPVTDRDMIIDIRRQDKPDGVVIALQGIEQSALPPGSAAIPKAKAKRVPYMRGSFELLPLSAQQTRIIYRMHLDLAGLSPGLANGRLPDTPFYTLKNAGKWLNSDRYR